MHACALSRARYGPIASERALAGRTPNIGVRSGPAHGHGVPAGHQPGFADRYIEAGSVRLELVELQSVWLETVSKFPCR